MNEFECYSTYTALKLHFTSDYDYFKYNGKCNVTVSSFNKRREKFFFKKLSREYNSEELVDFLVSNFSSNINMWIGDAFGERCVSTYREWKKRIESLQYNFRSDCTSIMDDDPKNFDSLFEIVDGQHPPIFRYVLAKKINIETFIILDDILNFIPRFNEELQDTIVWLDYFKMCMKYKPFFNHNLNNSKDTLKKVLEIQ